MKKKIIEFIPSMYDGGAETLVKDYALCLDRSIFEVTILCIYNIQKSANIQRLKENHIEILSIYHHHSLFNRILRVLFGEWYIPYKLKKIIRREKPNVIHIHLRLLKYTYKIRKELDNILLLYTCHNEPDIIFRNGTDEDFFAAQEMIKNNKLYLIALHDDMRNRLKKMFHTENVYTIKNGTDVEKFKNVKMSKQELQALYSIPQNSLVIGHIGRFCKQKNQLFLLEITKELLIQGANPFLILIGAGDKKEIEQRTLEMQLDKHVKVLSNRKDVPELLKAMDVFVFPSLFEGSPISLIEAQQAGVRCVISDTINNECIISDKTVVVPLKSSAKEWGNAILNGTNIPHAHNNPDDFDLRKNIKKLEDLYIHCGE